VVELLLFSQYQQTSDAYTRYRQNDQLRSVRTCPAQSMAFTGPAGLQSRRPFSAQCVTTSTHTACTWHLPAEDDDGWRRLL